MSNEAPLCIDLDGTLLRTDTLVESVLALIKSNQRAALRLPLWLFSGRAHFKQELGNNVALDVNSLPVNAEMVEHLRHERQCGRRLVLVTGADKRVGEAVAARFGFFDEVLGSDGIVNLTGKQKAAMLVERFGRKNFDYAGNARSDLAVWAVARKAILVNATPGLEAQARALCEVEQVIPPQPRGIRVWVRAFRVHQWCKNLLLFLPLMGSHHWGDVGTVEAVLVAFVAFSLAASSVYVLNDLLDLQSDRHHASKCHRPFASGQLPLAWGIAWVPVLLTASILVALTLPSSFCAAFGIYYLLTLAYSLRIKEAEILDVFVLAGLYAIRVLAGGYAAQVVVSDWLMAFSMFLFLSLAYVKRFTELEPMPEAGAGKVKGRGYCPKDLEVLGSMGVSSGYLSVLVLALYINHPAVTQLYGNPVALWFACPAVLYWISRVWLIAHRGEMHHDPIVFALTDKQSWVIALILLLIGAIAAPK
jgi:4-hydroxybenzoate polyprenyltransferase